MKQNPHDAALAYLNICSRTEMEVRKHLKGKGFGSEEADETLEFLRDCNLIDDRDYCLRYIEYAMGKGRGPLRIVRELTEKGVDSTLIREGLEECLDSEVERELAMALAEKQLGPVSRNEDDGGSPVDPDSSRIKYDEKELSRLARRLTSQGFHTNVIYDVLSKFRH